MDVMHGGESSVKILWNIRGCLNSVNEYRERGKYTSTDIISPSRDFKQRARTPRSNTREEGRIREIWLVFFSDFTVSILSLSTAEKYVGISSSLSSYTFLHARIRSTIFPLFRPRSMFLYQTLVKAITNRDKWDLWMSKATVFEFLLYTRYFVI